MKDTQIKHRARMVKGRKWRSLSIPFDLYDALERRATKEEVSVSLLITKLLSGQIAKG